VRLTEDMRRLVLEQRLGFAATVTPDARPNLSPKGTTSVLDEERLFFADIHSPQTVRNLESNPAIEINVVDPIVRRGYRFRGRGEVHRAGALYEQGLRVLTERGLEGGPERVRAIVVVEVTEAAELVSPAYDSGASEAEVARRWERRLGELRGWESVAREHPNARLVRRFHELQGAFYTGGPVEPLAELLAPDVRWHVPGASPIAGDYRGREPVLAYFERRRALAAATLALQVREVVAAGEFVYQRVDGQARLAGAIRSWETVGVLRVDGERISECWLIPRDQELFDAIWGAAERDRS
jgi:predicted pyridoxine 5'-phosphate oxidase superfamily flavin-nucleotide-binding protein/ketosteroid isomerase-like protein